MKKKTPPATGQDFRDTLCELDESLIQAYGWSLSDIDNTEADHMLELIQFMGRKYSKKERKEADGNTYKIICGKKMKKVDADHCSWL